MVLYSLDDLQTFSPEQINQILTYFKQPSSRDVNIDRLAAMILSYNNQILAPFDHPYITDPEFNQIYLKFATEESPILKTKQAIDQKRAQEVKLPSSLPSLTPQPSTPTFQPSVEEVDLEIQEVLQIPDVIPGGLGLYQVGYQLYVCGPQTYGFKEDLKTLGGKWSRDYKCWTFQLGLGNQVQRWLTEQVEKIKTLPEYQSDVKYEDLQIVRQGFQVLVVGPTYPHRFTFGQIGKFNKPLKAWVFPISQLGNIQAILSEIKQSQV